MTKSKKKPSDIDMGSSPIGGLIFDLGGED
jgi:hypothetical protein